MLSRFIALMLISALLPAATALFSLVKLPFPLAWGLFGVFALLALAGWQRQSSRLLTAAWLGFLGLSAVMGGYVADELNRSGSLTVEGFSLVLGLGLLLTLTLRPEVRH
ncbi:hypothetical protein GCM10017783_15350 [Deinococcus piscis]|uniref:Uncharacterized protein n=1 Tax=Deinococcus piscis TaxID=394230 RepID=A0ABQ3K689_9DEIO|nr:hypothetical protein [Deinococcus piscis]GHG03689.1 hypothetical protein GCM10017783_15350 [Deinococcus piscis]